MLDIDTRIVSAGAVDISAATPQQTAAVNVGKNGLAGEIWFVVHITDGTDQAVEPVTFELQVTIDNGSTYSTVAAVTFHTLVATAAVESEILAVPVGPIDLRTEQIAAASIDVRVQSRHVVVADADDLTFDAYLAGPQPFPPADDV